MRRATCAESSRPASALVRRLIVATGLVSVIPHPWTNSIPRDRNAAIIDAVGADPPVVTIRSDGTLVPEAFQ
jgi:hypothetical protein